MRHESLRTVSCPCVPAARPSTPPFEKCSQSLLLRGSQVLAKAMQEMDAPPRKVVLRYSMPRTESPLRERQMEDLGERLDELNNSIGYPMPRTESPSRERQMEDLGESLDELNNSIASGSTVPLHSREID